MTMQNLLDELIDDYVESRYDKGYLNEKIKENFA